jgi:hypothetical protein
MRSTNSALILAVTAISFTACANLYIDPIDVMRDRNKRNLPQLSVGMSRLEVDQIMGTDTAGGLLGTLHRASISNPYRIDTATGADRHEYEVLFYYTDVRKRDDVVTNDELTPVVLQHGKVIGWGNDFLAARVPKYNRAR